MLRSGIKVTALIDNGDMSFDIGIASALDNTTEFLLNNFDIIPRPQGVRLGVIFVLPLNISAVEIATSKIYHFSNVTLPGDLT